MNIHRFLGPSEWYEKLIKEKTSEIKVKLLQAGGENMNIHEQIANIKAGIVRESSKHVRQQMRRQIRNLEYKLSKEGVKR